MGRPYSGATTAPATAMATGLTRQARRNNGMPVVPQAPSSMTSAFQWSARNRDI